MLGSESDVDIGVVKVVGDLEVSNDENGGRVIKSYLTGCLLQVLLIPSLATFTELYPYQDSEAENDACMSPLRSNARSSKHEHMLRRLIQCTVSIREIAFPLSH